ncbi:VanZ family protein [Streptomyces sp. NPDC047821]|uniref:VanZ family protein n=1 Tax=Streptomyces sp. NPDC047821 TaxID=3365488 RepID=UPI003713B902
MNHTASPSAPPHRTGRTSRARCTSRTRRIVLLGLLLLAMAGALFALRRPLLMAAPMCLAGQWHGCFGTFNGVVFVTLATLPLAASVVWVLARRRRAAGASGAWRRSLAEVGMVHGTVPFLWMTMMPGAGAGTVPARVSLVPLRDLVTMGPLGIGGNLLVFAALGFFAPLRFAALASVPRVLALGASCSVLVEVAQYVLRLDRVSSVDDVLVNAAGAVLAALASRRWWRTVAKERSDRPDPAPAPAG